MDIKLLNKIKSKKRGWFNDNGWTYIVDDQCLYGKSGVLNVDGKWKDLNDEKEKYLKLLKMVDNYGIAIDYMTYKKIGIKGYCKLIGQKNEVLYVGRKKYVSVANKIGDVKVYNNIIMGKAKDEVILGLGIKQNSVKYDEIERDKILTFYVDIYNKIKFE